MLNKESNINWHLVQLVVLMFALLIYAGMGELSAERSGGSGTIPSPGKSVLKQQTESSPKNHLGLISAALFMTGRIHTHFVAY